MFIEPTVGRVATLNKRTSVHLLAHKLLNHTSTAVRSQERKSKHSLCTGAPSVFIARSAHNRNNNWCILGILSLCRRISIKRVYFLRVLLYIRMEYVALTGRILMKFGTTYLQHQEVTRVM
jgi:hypothetical protein